MQLEAFGGLVGFAVISTAKVSRQSANIDFTIVKYRASDGTVRTGCAVRAFQPQGLGLALAHGTLFFYNLSKMPKPEMNQKPNNATATRNSSSTQGTPAPKPGKPTIKQLTAHLQAVQANAQRVKNTLHLSHQYLSTVHSRQQKQLLKLHQLHDKLFAKPGLGKPAKTISQQRLNQYAQQAYQCIRSLMADTIDLGNELDHLGKQ